jgi:hypothetical protein
MVQRCVQRPGQEGSLQYQSHPRLDVRRQPQSPTIPERRHEETRQIITEGRLGFEEELGSELQQCHQMGKKGVRGREFRPTR